MSVDHAYEFRTKSYLESILSISSFASRDDDLFTQNVLPLKFSDDFREDAEYDEYHHLHSDIKYDFDHFCY